MRHGQFRIVSRPGELNEGLFGQIVLWAFELLPYLHAHELFPDWRITSRLYGLAPHFTVIPGVFDLAYDPPAGSVKEVDLYRLRALHASVLGGDWRALHALWHRYFRVPQRIVEAADEAALGSHTLGVHFRGQDKNALAWDTNAVSRAQFLTLMHGFIADHPSIDSLFVATDEFSFVRAIEQEFNGLRVVNLGEVTFHKHLHNVRDKADRALLDAVLLSRCSSVLKCSSALSGFAKILQPDLPIYRVAASKLFADIPYFPDAYIPPLVSRNGDSGPILQSLMKGDWAEDAQARARFAEPFAARPRFTGRRTVASWASYQRYRLRRLRGLTA